MNWKKPSSNSCKILLEKESLHPCSFSGTDGNGCLTLPLYYVGFPAVQQQLGDMIRRDLGLVGNDVVMTLSWCNKMVLFLNSQKKCDIGWHFWLYHIWVIWQWCVVLQQQVTADFADLIFYFCDSFKFTNSNKKILTTTHDHHSSLTVLWGVAKKISHHHQDGNNAAGHCSGNFTCNSPFWLLQLYWWVPPQATTLACLIVASDREAAI